MGGWEVSTSDTTSDPTSEIDILRRCGSMVRDLLPEDWVVSAVSEGAVSSWGERTAARGPDGLLEIVAPNGEKVAFVVEVRRLIARRDVPRLVEQLTRFVADTGTDRTRPLVAARYLSPSVREALASSSISYLDVTGNVRISASAPVMFVRSQGADKDPWRGAGRPRGTLAGEPAAKVVRALVRSRGPWSARELVAASNASTGATYRVLEFLRDEDLVTKSPRGKFDVVDWVRLLRRWSQDYGFLRNSRSYRFVDPRGVSALIGRIGGEREFQYAVSGSVAAAEWAPYAPARAAMIYVDDAERAAAEWGLVPTETGSNVILAEPDYDVVFGGTAVSRGGYRVVAIEQLVVDLLTGPGRNPAEGEELLRWMQANEDAWRDA